MIIDITKLSMSSHGQVLCPLESTPIVIGIGINYRSHAEESKVRMRLCGKAELIF